MGYKAVMYLAPGKQLVKVRGGGGPRSMVKDDTFALFNFGTLP